MANEWFGDKLEYFYLRLDKLLQNHANHTALDEELKQARQELLTFVEELRVNIEELRERNDELSEARSRIEAERVRYHDLFEFAPDGYLITDIAGTVLEANATASEMLGVPAQFLDRKPLAAYIYKEDRNEYRTKLIRALRQFQETGERVERWELRIQPRQREPFYALLIVGVSNRQRRSFRNPLSKDEVFVRWIVHDITERRQAQDVLERAQEDLERRVGERTEELSATNAELLQIASQLEARNKELQEFAFIASHDLQEPLRKVRAFSDTLMMRIQDPKSVDYLERMRSAAVRMQAMLDGLLEYARVSSQGRPFEPTDLNVIARDVVDNLELRVQQTGGRIELAPLPTVIADPLQMYRLFQNLLVNALKFHQPEEPPVVAIRSWTNGGATIVRIADNGIGFDPAHLDRLFQPFSRLQGRNQYEGSGMGLAICRKIVERHGGSITAESAPNEGSTFIVTLPAAH